MYRISQLIVVVAVFAILIHNSHGFIGNFRLFSRHGSLSKGYNVYRENIAVNAVNRPVAIDRYHGGLSPSNNDIENERGYKKEMNMAWNDKWKSNKRKTSANTKFRKGPPQRGPRDAGPKSAFRNDKIVPPVSDKKSLMKVNRVRDLKDRAELSTFNAGEKHRGRIISITEYGMFVDIGSTRDGLVHVRDMSPTYFIRDHQARFNPGEDIDVWIKYVDQDTNKLNLQLYPLTEVNRPSINKVQMDQLIEGETIQGLVIRSSDYGVFVDIGAGIDAYLHKRKMKIGKKRLSWKPWEIFPIGSKVDGFIYDVNVARKRIELTTYNPDEWDDKLPEKVQSDEEFDEEDDEALGGSTRADNVRALQRILAIDEDDEEYLDEEDDELEEEDIEDINSEDTYEKVEILSQEEIDEIVRQRMERKNQLESSVIADDTLILDTKKLKNIQSDEDNDLILSESEEMEISSEELFKDLSRGKSYISMNDLKQWDYVSQAMIDGDISEKDLITLFREAGGIGHSGKLDEEQFDIFLDLFADFLDLDSQDNILIDDSADDDTDADDLAEILLDETKDLKSISSNQESSSQNIDDDVDNDLMSVSGGISGPDKRLSFSDLQNDDESSSSNPLPERKYNVQLSESMFKSISGKKGYILLEDVFQWDIAKALLDAKLKTEADIENYFKDALQKNSQPVKLTKSKQSLSKAKLDKQGFESLLLSISSVQNPGIDDKKTNRISTTEIDSIEDDQDDISLDKLAEKDPSTDDLFNYVFKSVAGKKGYVLLKDLLKWEFVKSMMDNDGITKAQVTTIFNEGVTRNQPSDKNKKETIKKNSEERLDSKGFQYVLDTISEREISLDKASKESKGFGKSIIKEDQIIRPSSDILSPSSLNGAKILSQEDDIDDNDDMSVSDNEFLDVQGTFNDLAGDKTTATFDDLSTWVLVQEMIEDQLLTMEKFREFFIQAGGKALKASKRKSSSTPKDADLSIDYRGFEILLDLLATVVRNTQEGAMIDFDQRITHDENMIGLQSNTISSGFIPTPSSLSISEQSVSKKVDKIETSANTDDDRKLLESVFKGLSGGKEHVSLKDLINWDFVLQLMAEGFLTEEELKEKMQLFGANRKGLSLDGFDKLTDDLVILYKEKGGEDEFEDSEEEADDEEDDEEDGEEDGEYYDIDTEVSFNDCAKGKNYVTYQDILDWSLMKALFEGNHLNSSELRDILDRCGLLGNNKITIADFEVFLEELTDNVNGGEDDDDFDDEEEEEE